MHKALLEIECHFMMTKGTFHVTKIILNFYATFDIGSEYLRKV